MVQTAKEGAADLPLIVRNAEDGELKGDVRNLPKARRPSLPRKHLASLPHQGRGVGSVTAEMMDAIRACI